MSAERSRAMSLVKWIRVMKPWLIGSPTACEVINMKRDGGLPCERTIIAPGGVQHVRS